MKFDGITKNIYLYSIIFGSELLLIFGEITQAKDMFKL